MNFERNGSLFRYRLSLGVFIGGLIASGLTAFPLQMETALLNRWFEINGPVDPTSNLFPLRAFIYTVHYALHDTYQRFPFFGYGTDWLGFGHLVIAAFFILPFLDPIRYRSILHIGLLACAGVVVVALTAGPIRGIPFFWTLIDCSFGILGAIPLIYCLRLARGICLEDRKGC
ncbi:MAG: hypothetical protein ABI925_05425 [Verrucomicrobiota bacterium]